MEIFRHRRKSLSFTLKHLLGMLYLLIMAMARSATSTLITLQKKKQPEREERRQLQLKRKIGTKGWYQTLSVGQTFLLPQVVAERWQKIQVGVRWNG